MFVPSSTLDAYDNTQGIVLVSKDIPNKPRSKHFDLAQQFTRDNERVDFQAPGIRDQVPNPTFFDFGPTVSALYKRWSNVNTAPWFNHDESAVGNFKFLQDDQARRQQTRMYEIIVETPIHEHIRNKDLTPYSVPYTGFSPFAEIKMTGTMPFI